MEQLTIILKDPAAKVTSELYASRNDIVTVSAVDDEIDLKVVKVTPLPDFGPDDYLVCVKRRGDRTEMSTLVGKAPTWAAFPDLWRDWVNNEDVLHSAWSFVWTHLNEKPENVARADELYNIATIGQDVRPSDRKAAWSAVAKLLGIDPAEVVGTGSRTAAQAMPIRIAQKLSKGRPMDQQWKPPVARPKYEDPTESSRVRVAPLVPANEAWLYRNPKALGAVQRGLADAKAGKFVTVNIDQPPTEN